MHGTNQSPLKSTQEVFNKSPKYSNTGICKYWLNGKCKYGLKCSLKHYYECEVRDGNHINANKILQEKGEGGHRNLIVAINTI